MNVIVIGGVAAGTKTAAKLKRENRDANVTIYTKSQDISYAGCGLPYYVGGSIETRDELIVNTPAKYKGLTGVDVVTGMEATSVDANAKTVTVRNVVSGEANTVSYDKLVVAVGAEPFVPPVEGVNRKGVYTMRTPDDAIGLRAYVDDNHCRNAVVVSVTHLSNKPYNVWQKKNWSSIHQIRVCVCALAPPSRALWAPRRPLAWIPAPACCPPTWWCWPSASVPPPVSWLSPAWRW